MARKSKSLTIGELFWSTAFKPGFFSNQEPLPLVVLGIACIDQQLRTLLATFFVECETAEELLDFNSGFLGSFRARANTAYALGLIPKTVFQSICILAEIRNKTAHHHMELSFDDDDMVILIDGTSDKGKPNKPGLNLPENFCMDLERKTGDINQQAPRMWTKTGFSRNLNRKDKFGCVVRFCTFVISQILLNRVPAHKRVSMTESQEPMEG